MDNDDDFEPSGAARPDMEALMRRARRSAVEYLSKRSASEEELRRVLLRRAKRWHAWLPNDTTKALAEHGVEFCRKQGFLDDRAYAASKARAGVRAGRSRVQIAADLRARGITGNEAAEAMNFADDMKAAARYARRRKFGPFGNGGNDPETARREEAAMARRGFGSQTARRVLSLPPEEAEEAARA